MTEGSLHYKDGVENNPWPKDVTASRTFRTLPAGKGAYNYRSKVLMGMAQTRVLNEPPSTTPKDAVTFSLPSITKPNRLWIICVGATCDDLKEFQTS